NLYPITTLPLYPISLLSNRVGRQTERQQLAAVARTTDCDRDVLTAAEHVGHRRAGLRRRHRDRTGVLTCRLVVGPEHRTTLATGQRDESALAGNHQRLGRQDADAALAARALRIVDPQAREDLLDVVGRVAVGNLPHKRALVQIERGN